MRIFKYPIKVIGYQNIEMPLGASILTVDVQTMPPLDISTPCLWANVEPGNNLESREIFIYGTGHDISDNKKLSYIGTFQLNGGQFVGHVFENYHVTLSG